MLGFIFVVIILCLVLIIEQLIWRQTKNFPAEYLRKFIHMSTGTILAFSPWYLSWNQIQLIGLLISITSLINIRVRIFHHLSSLRRGYGELYLGLAVLVLALTTKQELFFCLAVLNMALADGLAAVVGQTFGRKWSYKVFGQTKTVIGTMTFWLISMLIFGIGLLFAGDLISFAEYALIILLAPPLLAMIENLGVFGLDNLAVPLLALVILNLAG